MNQQIPGTYSWTRSGTFPWSPRRSSQGPRNQAVQAGWDYRPISLDVRVITATNRDLSGLIVQGKFRQDLYFRINVVRMNLPPLRERKEAASGGGRISPAVGQKDTRLSDEKSGLIRALNEARGNKSAAAKILGVNRMTVQNRTFKYGLQVVKKVVD